MTLARILRVILKSPIDTGLFLALAAFFIIPHPFRAFVPSAFGFAEVAPNVFVDAAENRTRLESLVASAEADTRAFFGPLNTNPAWVICTTSECAATLRLRANGLTYADLLIVLGPGGVNARTAAHERLHAELHQYVGIQDAISPRFPAWFDEGLATHMSGDTRVRRPANPRDADWIKEADRYTGWVRLRERHSGRDRYGAAARLVEEIEDTAGRDGLKDLIRRVGEDAEDFDSVLDDIMKR